MLLGSYSSPSNFYTTAQVVPIEPVFHVKFDLLVDNLLRAYVGFSNLASLKFKPRTEEVEIINGNFDFSRNNVVKVEILTPWETLSSSYGDIQISNDSLLVKFGRLSVRGEYKFKTIVYVLDNAQGVVFGEHRIKVI